MALTKKNRDDAWNFFRYKAWANYGEAGRRGVIIHDRWDSHYKAAGQGCDIIKRAKSPTYGKFIFDDEDGNECFFEFVRDKRGDVIELRTNAMHDGYNWVHNPDFKVPA